MASEKVVIEALVSGYRGLPVKIIALCDAATGAVLVHKAGDPKESTSSAGNALIVTDSPGSVRNWGLAYDERQHMLEVIKTYFELQRTGRIKIADSLLRYNPDAIIQTRKIDERGAVFEFDSQSTENGHVAVMLAIWAAKKSIQGREMSELLEDDNSSDDDDDGMPFSL